MTQLLTRPSTELTRCAKIPDVRVDSTLILQGAATPSQSRLAELQRLIDGLDQLLRTEGCAPAVARLARS